MGKRATWTAALLSLSFLASVVALAIVGGTGRPPDTRRAPITVLSPDVEGPPVHAPVEGAASTLGPLELREGTEAELAAVAVPGGGVAAPGPATQLDQEVGSPEGPDQSGARSAGVSEGDDPEVEGHPTLPAGEESVGPKAKPGKGGHGKGGHGKGGHGKGNRPGGGQGGQGGKGGGTTLAGGGQGSTGGSKAVKGGATAVKGGSGAKGGGKAVGKGLKPPAWKLGAARAGRFESGRAARVRR